MLGRRVPLVVAVPIVVLSGIAGVAAGVWLPISEAPPAPPSTNKAASVSPESVPDVADPAPQPSPIEHGLPAVSPDPAPQAAALEQSREEEPELASHQLASPAPSDETRHEPEQHAAATSEAGPAGAAEGRQDVPDGPETPPSASAPESTSASPIRSTQSEPSQRWVVAQPAAEKKRPPARRAASAPTRRVSEGKPRRDRTADARDRPPARRDQQRPMLSQLPLIGPVFGMFTR
jgi:hypothetical protein